MNYEYYMDHVLSRLYPVVLTAEDSDQACWIRYNLNVYISSDPESGQHSICWSYEHCDILGRGAQSCRYVHNLDTHRRIYPNILFLELEQFKALADRYIATGENNLDI